MHVLAKFGGAIGYVCVPASPCDSFGDLRRQLSRRLGEAAPAEADMWLEHRGRSWGEDITLAQAGVSSATPVTVHLRLRGGGGDGGSTGAESRSSYLEMYAKKKADKVNPAEAKLAQWTRCTLSGEVLQAPVVADELGSLYNKDAVVQALLTKSLPASLSHISSLKHLINLILEPNSAAGRSVADARSFQPGNDAPFVCPVSGAPLNGRFRFVVLRKTGHVVSEKALKQAASAVKELVGDFSQEDVMPINGTEEEVYALRQAMLAKRAAAKGKKLQKQATKAPAANTRIAAEQDALRLQAAANAAEARSIVTSGVVAQELAAALKGPQSGSKRDAEGLPAAEQPLSKRSKPPKVPQGASTNVYSSIFLSSRPAPEKETYMCRSTSARGMNMT